MKLAHHYMPLARGTGMLALALALALTLSACATPPPLPALPEVREFAAASARLDAFADLTRHYRDTYTRELPYLSAAAAAEEKRSDALRHAEYGDFLRIQKSVVLYLETLGKLAGAQQYDMSASVKNVVGGIRAWPGSGIGVQQGYAYTRLGQLVTAALTATAQQTAAAEMLKNGAEPLQNLLEAMSALLRYYDKTADNERDIVLGLFEVELPFMESSQHRLPSALAKATQVEKKSEFSAIGRRSTLAQKQLQAIMAAHRLLLEEMARPAPGSVAVIGIGIGAGAGPGIAASAAAPGTASTLSSSAPPPPPASASAPASTSTSTSTLSTRKPTPLQLALRSIADSQIEPSLDVDSPSNNPLQEH